jgi:hypothetical protein
VLEPGAVATKLTSHNSDEVMEAVNSGKVISEPLQPGRGQGTAQNGLPRPSFTHLIHLYLTQNDGLQSEAANRLVPCKYKGIRGFSETFGND